MSRTCLSFDVGRDVYTGTHKNRARFLPPLDSSTRPARDFHSARPGTLHISYYLNFPSGIFRYLLICRSCIMQRESGKQLFSRPFSPRSMRSTPYGFLSARLYRDADALRCVCLSIFRHTHARSSLSNAAFYTSIGTLHNPKREKNYINMLRGIPSNRRRRTLKLDEI